MKKLALAAATCALGLWGCANTSTARSESGSSTYRFSSALESA